MLRVGGDRGRRNKSQACPCLCVCVGEGQVVFISGGVWQEELSDVEADSKKELGSSKSSSSSTGGIGIGIAQDVQRSSSCRDYYSNGQLEGDERMCCPDGTEEPSARKSRKCQRWWQAGGVISKARVAAGDRDWIYGMEWRGVDAPGGGGIPPGSIGQFYTDYTAHTLDVCWLE